jgi:cytochrome c551/c552
MALLAGCTLGRLSAQPAHTVAGGEAQRGAVAIRNYGCGACHRIPGIAGAISMAGPPLDDWAQRRYIAGKLPNQPQNLIQWIRFPQAIAPGSAMPDLNVSEADARDISAYLFSLTGN